MNIVKIKYSYLQRDFGNKTTSLPIPKLIAKKKAPDRGLIIGFSFM